MRNSHTLTSSPARSLSHCWKNVWEVPSFPARPVRPILMGVTYVIIRLYGQFEQCVRAGHLFLPDQSVQSWSELCNYSILCTFRKCVRALRGAKYDSYSCLYSYSDPTFRPDHGRSKFQFRNRKNYCMIHTGCALLGMPNAHLSVPAFYQCYIPAHPAHSQKL